MEEGKEGTRAKPGKQLVVYIFIHIRPEGPMIRQIYIKDSRPTAHPLLLSRQRRHFGAPSESVHR